MQPLYNQNKKKLKAVILIKICPLPNISAVFAYVLGVLKIWMIY